jgi:hypothetical protein
MQGVREWFPKNFRVSLSEKMWSKTFLKIKLFPAVLGLNMYPGPWPDLPALKLEVLEDCYLPVRVYTLPLRPGISVVG